MPPFFFALVATLLAATGGRDQRMAANLSARLGQSTGLLVTLWIVSAASAVAAAAIGSAMAQLLPSEGAKGMFVAFALLLGAIELAWPFLWKEPAEPTRSLVAIAFVVASRQLLDAARFIVVALSAATGAPVLAAIGGAIGGGAAVTLGWALGEGLTKSMPLRAIRLGIAVLLLAAALWTGLSARGIL
jgi:putative Ca2+/H+ antiporter (TMEM165/GDT1 family)